MNQFSFCVVVDGQILYGTLQARGGIQAREILEEKFGLKTRDLRALEIKGVASKTFDFDVVGRVTVL